MKHSQRVWLLRIYIALVAAYLIYDAVWRGHAAAALFGIGVTLVVFALIFPPIAKQAILKAFPADAVPLPVSPDDFPLLDRAQLQTLTAKLQELGFVALCDYSTNSSGASASFFARVMLHDEQHCIVEINQPFPQGKAWPMSVQFQSFFGDGPQRTTFERSPLPSPGAPLEKPLPDTNFWRYTTHNQRPYFLARLWRHPRFIGRRMRGGAPSELWLMHLADREKIAARLDLPLARNLSIEHYFTWCHWIGGVYRGRLQRTNFYLALPRAFFDGGDQWWGELGRIEPDS